MLLGWICFSLVDKRGPSLIKFVAWLVVLSGPSVRPVFRPVVVVRLLSVLPSRRRRRRPSSIRPYCRPSKYYLYHVA